MAWSALTRSGVIRAKEGRKAGERSGGSSKEELGTRAPCPPSARDRLHSSQGICRPALPKLAGLHQGAQLTLTSERAPDPPEGTFTLCLFRRNFHQEHGISTGSVSINKMRQVPLSSERGPGIFYPKGNPLLFSFFTYSDRTLLCCAPSAGPVARCRHCAPASLHLHLFPLVLSFFLRMPLAPE